MKIHNIRLGFATNSSSTHSIVILKTPQEDSDIEDDEFGDGFGWQYFVAASEEAKRRYLVQTLQSNMRWVYKIPQEDAVDLASLWTGARAINVNKNGYVDHQSLIVIPIEKQDYTTSLNKKFFEDLKNFILKPEIAILGGNDNEIEECGHPLLPESIPVNLNLIKDGRPENYRARYDNRGKYWSIFNTKTGKRIHISFDADADASQSEVPELVDLKITDKCYERCPYCYQGSSPDGQHADLDIVEQVLRNLSDMKTFEIAFGGGEPTLYPDFLKIIKHCTKYYDIKPNFSTRNFNWVLKNYDVINKYIGGIGLSISSSYDDLVKILSKIKALEKEHIQSSDILKITVQIVHGTMSKYDYQEILKICEVFDCTLLFLGWKNVGRGKGYKVDYDVNLGDLIDSYDKNDLPRIAFDTVMANMMKEWLEKRSDSICYSLQEGSHSMYIDCVNKKMGESSFSDKLVDFFVERPLTEQIKKVFT